jgi:hypothetical protein
LTKLAMYQHFPQDRGTQVGCAAVDDRAQE